VRSTRGKALSSLKSRSERLSPSLIGSEASSKVAFKDHNPMIKSAFKTFTRTPFQKGHFASMGQQNLSPKPDGKRNFPQFVNQSDKKNMYSEVPDIQELFVRRQ